MKRFLPLLILLFLIFVTFFSNRAPKINQTNLNSKDADFKFVNVTISMHSNGKKTWTINASQSFIYKASSTFFFQDVNGSLFENATNLHFDSPTGGFDMKSSTLKMAKTNAQLDYNSTKYYVTCDEIEIDAKNSRLVGYGNLFINSDQIMLKGKQLLADLKINRIEVLDDVEGSFFHNTIN